jgi:hypothetical protein
MALSRANETKNIGSTYHKTELGQVNVVEMNRFIQNGTK